MSIVNILLLSWKGITLTPNQNVCILSLLSSYSNCLKRVTYELYIHSLWTCSTITVQQNGWGRGGTTTGRWYRDVPRLWLPFFRPVGTPEPNNLASLPRSCAPPPLIFNLKKKMHFQPCQKFSSQDAKFLNFHFQNASFFKKICSLHPFLATSAAHT